MQVIGSTEAFDNLTNILNQEKLDKGTKDQRGKYSGIESRLHTKKSSTLTRHRPSPDNPYASKDSKIKSSFDQTSKSEHLEVDGNGVFSPESHDAIHAQIEAERLASKESKIAITHGSDEKDKLVIECRRVEEVEKQIQAAEEEVERNRRAAEAKAVVEVESSRAKAAVEEDRRRVEEEVEKHIIVGDSENLAEEKVIVLSYTAENCEDLQNLGNAAKQLGAVVSKAEQTLQMLTTAKTSKGHRLNLTEMEGCLAEVDSARIIFNQLFDAHKHAPAAIILPIQQFYDLQNARREKIEMTMESLKRVNDVDGDSDGEYSDDDESYDCGEDAYLSDEK